MDFLDHVQRAHDCWEKTMNPSIRWEAHLGVMYTRIAKRYNLKNPAEAGV